MRDFRDERERSIPQRVQEKLKFYVYLYVDPRDNKPFYIGKGRGNRILSHLNDREDTEKSQKIAELKKQNYEPLLEILKYGLDSDHEAFLVESVAIDLLDVKKLTNKVRGHGSVDTGRHRLTDLVQELDAAEADITDSVIMININQHFRYGMSEAEMYDTTRGVWKLDPTKAKRATYAFSMYAGIVREVYKIADWFPCGATWTTRNDLQDQSDSESGRWEFVGNIATASIRQKYVGKSVKTYSLTQNPIRYVNVQ